jgi:hypothetical protein
MESNCGFDRSQLHSDEAPPIGVVDAEGWTEVAAAVTTWVLRWN